MTALDQYQRLEALALWRADRDAEPREVIATFGNSRLTLLGMDESPITQWSLAALRPSDEADPAGRAEALALTPDPEGAECLWFEDADMKAAITAVWVPQEEKEPQTVGPRGGKLFRATMLFAALVLVALALLFGGATARNLLIAQVPDEVWRSVSDDIVATQARLSGLALCERPGRADPALRVVQTRLGATEARGAPVLFTSATPLAPVITLPDGRVLIDADAMRAAQQPEALAGLMALGLARQDVRQPQVRLATELAFVDLLGLVTRGKLGAEALRQAARVLHSMPSHEPGVDAEALRLLEAAGLPSAPLALALSGPGLPIDRLEALAGGDTIGAEPFEPALADQDWLALRNRCMSR